MNLLIYVMALLLVMSAMSYQALDHFKISAHLRNQWLHYMRVESTCQFNGQVTKEFKTLSRNKGKSVSEDEKEKINAGVEKDSRGSSTINFRYLVKAEYAEAHPKEAELMVDVIKRLMTFLYGNQVFFQEALQKYPHAMDDLILALRQANKEKEVSSVKNLMQLPLKEESLQNFWYQLLKENVAENNVLEMVLQSPLEINTNRICFMVSLRDYLNNRNELKVRLYLAPRALLYAILQSKEAVAEIIEKRTEIYKSLGKKGDAVAATKAFEDFCMQYSPVKDLQSILSFYVTSTNPAYYEEAILDAQEESNNG